MANRPGGRAPTMKVVGVDGSRGGWLAAVVDDAGVTWHYATDVRDLLALEAAVVGIDIPIGLPDRGTRACDVAARRLLGRRASSVFPAPLRGVLACATYADARATLAGLGGASMSAQAFGIVRAVARVDAALTPDDNSRVVEVHPELVLRHLDGAELPPKKTPEGERRRRAALRRIWPDLDAIVALAPRPARVDDALDALACAVGARRWLDGEATVLGDGETDPRGLPMRIAF